MNKFLKLITISMTIVGLIFVAGCDKDDDTETIYDSFDIQNVMCTQGDQLVECSPSWYMV